MIRALAWAGTSALILFFCELDLSAVEGQAVSIENSAGKTVTLMPRGTSPFAWYVEEATGYTVLRIPGRYEYAYRGAAGDLARSGLLVGAVDPAAHGLRHGVTPSRGFLQSVRANRRSFGPVKASPRPVRARQPDGTTVELMLRGDEVYSWYEEKATGYSAIHVRERYEYALRGADGKLVSTGLEVGTVDPAEHGLTEGISPSP